jgi:hypothetical protein
VFALVGVEDAGLGCPGGCAAGQMTGCETLRGVARGSCGAACESGSPGLVNFCGGMASRAEQGNSRIIFWLPKPVKVCIKAPSGCIECCAKQPFEHTSLGREHYFVPHRDLG